MFVSHTRPIRSLQPLLVSRFFMDGENRLKNATDNNDQAGRKQCSCQWLFEVTILQIWTRWCCSSRPWSSRGYEDLSPNSCSVLPHSRIGWWKIQKMPCRKWCISVCRMNGTWRRTWVFSAQALIPTTSWGLHGKLDTRFCESTSHERGRDSHEMIALWSCTKVSVQGDKG